LNTPGPASRRSQFHAGQARTLQRRFRDWRARHGIEPEVFSQQVAVPGREAAIDFTHGTDLGVTIAGGPFPHLLFEFVLSYSHWTWVAIAFGETFEALAASVQGALWALGGVPAILRSDNLSTATHELKTSNGRDLTPRFREAWMTQPARNLTDAHDGFLRGMHFLILDRDPLGHVSAPAAG